MSDSKYYDFNVFKQQLETATELLKEMNEAATYMRWQYDLEKELEAFKHEVDVADGWIQSWCH